MDRLSIFSKTDSVNVDLSTTEGSAADQIVDELNDIKRETILLRKGLEAWSWGEEVLDSEDIDLEGVTLEETE